MNLKKFTIIFLAIVALILSFTPSPSSAQSSGDRVYDVRAYGAKGDCTNSGATGSCTNDVAATRKVIAILNSAGGGVMYFPNTPTNAYYLQTGDPTTDPNMSNIDANHYAVWKLTSDNIKIVLAPGVTVRLESTYLYQTNAGGGGIPGQEYLIYFGNGVTTISNFALIGNWGTFKFAPTGGASYFTGGNSANGFLFHSGSQIS